MTPGFERVSSNRVIFRFRSVMFEMHRLTRVRTDTCRYKHEPGVHLAARVEVVGRQEFSGLFGKVKQYGVAVEHEGVIINQSRCLGVRVDFEKRRIVLFSLARIKRYEFIRKAGLLQKKGNL